MVSLSSAITTPDQSVTIRACGSRPLSGWLAVVALSPVILIMLLLPGIAGAAADLQPRSYRASHNRTLEVGVPSAWEEKIGSSRGFPKIEFSSGAPREFLASLTLLWSGATEADRDSLKVIRTRLKRQAAGTLKSYKTSEQDAELRPLEAGRIIGYCYTVTDPAPPAGYFRSMTEGEVIIGELTVHFVIMTHDPGAPQLAAFLDMIRTGKQGVPALTPAAAASLRRVPVPDRDWAIVAALEGFRVEERPSIYEFDSEDRMYSIRGWKWFASNPGDGLMLSIFVDEPGIGATPSACRDLYWARIRAAMPGMIKEATLSEGPDMAIVEYLVPRHQGRRVDLRHANAYLARDRSCVDVHVSKLNYRAEDSGLFERILRSLRIVPLKEAPGDEVPAKGDRTD